MGKHGTTHRDATDLIKTTCRLGLPLLAVPIGMTARRVHSLKINRDALAGLTDTLLAVRPLERCQQAMLIFP